MKESKFSNSDKILVLTAVGLGLFVSYNMWGDIFGEMISEYLKHLFHFIKI